MPSNTAEKLADKFTLIFPYYEELLPFESKMNRRFKITIFDNSAEFQDYQRQKSMTHSESGFYRFELGELALLYQGMESTVRTLYHEGFHAYLQERIIRPPQWLNEGLAEYFEKTRTTWFSKLLVSPSKTDWASTLSTMDRNNTIPDISDIVDYDWPDRHNLTKEQYALSWSLVHFFKETGSDQRKEQFKQYLELLYKKQDPKKAFYMVWSDDLEELNREWHNSIKKIVVKNFFLL
ncbi:MAG: DUF1570 domain-containing protein [Candidatus Omnitrophica bacterium]|nr:DUF1570 domain-containing protein [Candidatus Omnitrophota bacterium]